MYPITFSIRAQLTLFIGLLAAALLMVTLLAAARLTVINRAAAEIDHKWLAGRNLLGDLREQLAHVRIAELDRALASEMGDRVRLEQAAAGDARATEQAQVEYSALMGEQRPSKQLRDLQRAIRAYLSAHERWQAVDKDGSLDAPARAGGSLDVRYSLANAAADRVIASNGAASASAGRDIEGLVRSTLYAMIGVATLALLLGVWLLRRVRRAITSPLSSITAALSRLAAGERDIEVPESDRADEIGEMARAFNVFRANALALEVAHEATRVAQARALDLARHDTLTGLPNRRLLSLQMDRALADVREKGSHYVLLLVDLDRFKPVNDLHGHAAGDAVLCEVAERLKRQAYPDHTIARLGGDEFAIIVSVADYSSDESALLYGEQILSLLRQPIAIGTMTVGIDASIGIVRFDDGAADPEALLRAADIAMYRAKRDGRGTIRLFEQSMDAELRAQAALEADLREAIAAGKIESHYQPIVDLSGGGIYGFEILARWQHPARGAVSPEQFIPLAEQIGLIADLTWSVLRQACRDAQAWPKSVHLSVNISPFHLKDPLLAVRLLAILTQEGFSPHCLQVEVTESALVEDLQTAKATLTSLQHIGVKVALDDFGTGYSSLSHLRELRFDKVKIDRSFVKTMHDNNESEKIVDAILNLASSLAMPTVAEGIESSNVAKLLAQKGCEYGQGYYFGKATDAFAVAVLLADERGSAGRPRPCRGDE